MLSHTWLSNSAPLFVQSDWGQKGGECSHHKRWNFFKVLFTTPLVRFVTVVRLFWLNSALYGICGTRYMNQKRSTEFSPALTGCVGVPSETEDMISEVQFEKHHTFPISDFGASCVTLLWHFSCEQQSVTLAMSSRRDYLKTCGVILIFKWYPMSPFYDNQLFPQPSSVAIWNYYKQHCWDRMSYELVLSEQNQNPYGSTLTRHGCGAFWLPCGHRSWLIPFQTIIVIAPEEVCQGQWLFYIWWIPQPTMPSSTKQIELGRSQTQKQHWESG